MGMPPHRGSVRRVDELAQRRQVVFDIVDRIGRARGGRPVEPRATFDEGTPLQRLVVRDVSGDRAHDVEHVERGHAGARSADVDPRI
jgi:hypothetical protein